ncbi:hypothetical protein BH11PSE5_BH11PSE5_29560 [soil metagenome]|jgi:putative photosynthetic complex assembly protein|uniref:photosynthetic complex assembly protein PuhC n=1 Tax=unclassified Sphingobium TaxID=2611147 RepID=UPI001E53BF86|nr:MULTISPECIES: photosynthetic complex assembly protein PuhC [unclassified Sphingobium]GLI97419.1 hypothetical protein Sbs19_12370 [Sphingobium sp. BS19]CAH0353787.1 hypothetical protein SPH9361_02642 [Sphingobium sp. CECT 9361]
MSATHSHEGMLPRGTLMIAGALVAFALTATTAVRVFHIPPVASPVALRTAEHIAPVQTRNIRFIDRKDGAVVIQDSDTGATAYVIEPGMKTGFVRAVMRGLARDRMMRGIGSTPPFTLTLWKDGQLSLTDTVTKRTTEMTAFGTDNRAAFLILLANAGKTQ